MASGDRRLPQSYTQVLSNAIDAAYERFRVDEPNSDLELYDAFMAQAANVIWFRLQRADSDFRNLQTE